MAVRYCPEALKFKLSTALVLGYFVDRFHDRMSSSNC